MNPLKKAVQGVGMAICVVVVVGAVVVLFTLDFEAYRQRFPNAQPWTYLFQPTR